MTTVAASHPAGFDETLFKAYEDGKHRRYNLLFAVNGGAFAVARVLGEKGSALAGNLTMSDLAIGMILFTLLMGLDIFMFGLKMRAQWEASQPGATDSPLKGLFALPGRIVLVALCILIGVGWWRVA